MERRP